MLFAEFVGFAENPIDKFSESYCRVRQIPGTEAVFSEYFSGINLTDTAYCIIYPVGNCFRCEAAITPIYKGLKKVDPNKSVVLVSVLHDSIAARNYQERFAYESDFYIYDSDDGHEGFLSFNVGYLHIPYVLKILPRKGELIVGTEHYSTHDYFSAMAQCHELKEKLVFPLSTEIAGKYIPTSDELVLKNRMPVIYDSSTRLAKFINPVCFVDNRLLITDDLEMRPIIFNLNHEGNSQFVFNRFLEPDSAQKRQFSEIDDKDFEMMSKSLRYIPISPAVFNDGTLAAAYSLPKLWYEDEKSIAYMNQGCFIKVSDMAGDSATVIPFGFDPWKNLFYQHFVLYNYGKDIAIKCEPLTWPMDFDKKEYVNTPENNPFDDRFYDSEIPTMAVLDASTGALKKHIGRLPELARRTKTGYYFMNPITDSFGEDIAYTDGFTGKIYVFDSTSDKRLEDYDIFNIPDSVVPVPDESKFYSIECVEQYKRLFSRRISSISLTPDFVHCLVMYDYNGKPSGKENYSVVRIDRRTGKIKEMAFPRKECGLQYHYALRKHRDGREPEPAAIIGENGQWTVETYSFETSY